MISLETFLVVLTWVSVMANLAEAVYYSIFSEREVCTSAGSKAAAAAVTMFIQMLVLMWMKLEGWW